MICWTTSSYDKTRTTKSYDFYRLSDISFTVVETIETADYGYLLGLYGCRPKSASAGLSCGLRWTTTLSVLHSAVEVAHVNLVVSGIFVAAVFVDVDSVAMQQAAEASSGRSAPLH